MRRATKPRNLGIAAAAVLLPFVAVVSSGQDTLPPLIDGKAPQTLEAMWAGYDPAKEPLDVKVVHEWQRTYDGHAITVQMLTYTVGTFKGTVSRMGAYYAYPSDVSGKIPGLLHMHGGGQRAAPETVETAAANGYACIDINWGGRPMADQKPDDPGTDWGAIDPSQQTHNDHYASLAPDDRTIDTVDSPRNNNWFPITIAARRALTFLARQPNIDPNRLGVYGHSMGGTLTVYVAGIDPRVAAASPSCGGTAAAPKDVRDRPGASFRPRNRDPLYYETTDNIGSIRRITCPILYRGPQNDFNGIYDNLNSNWRQMPSQSIHLTDSPHLNHRHAPESAFAIWPFFDAFLKSEGTFPTMPQLTVSLKTADGVPRATVQPDHPDEIDQVRIYYSINPHSLTRFWRSAVVSRHGNEWTAPLPILSDRMPLVVMANVYYPQKKRYDGPPWDRSAPPTYLVSSWDHYFTPAELQAATVKATDHLARTIQTSFDNWDDWYQLNWGNPYWRLAATRKLTDPKWCGPDGADLAIDVCDPAGGQFVMTFNVNDWSAYAGLKAGQYYAAAPLVKTAAWQTVTFHLPDLKPQDQKSPPKLASWQGITELGIVAALHDRHDGQDKILAGGPWPDTRQLRNLRWVGGDYKQPPLLPGAKLSAKEFQSLYQDNIDRSVQQESQDARNAEESPKPVAWWTCDENVNAPSVGSVFESVAKVRDRAEGFFGITNGVSGRCLKFDGFTTHVIRTRDQLTPLGDSFSFEAWVAPQVYPWNWTAIVNQEHEHKAGWFFGVSGEGRVGLHVAMGGKWLECNTKSQLPLLKWSHVMGTFDAREGLRVYINGKLEGELKATGPVTPATDVDVWMGMSHTKNCPIRTERAFSKTFLSPLVFDGLIDEVKIYPTALAEAEVASAYAAVQPRERPPLKYRILPAGPTGPTAFGAVYTRLNYCPEWERLWRVGDNCDILVRFDESPTKVIFWRGMNYGACYVSENGLWSGDQSLEVNSAEKGCFEHMSDKQCQFQSAKIVENNDARVVVHARYACVAIDLSFLRTDPDTRWGIWADEYFTIYPDGVTVRHAVAVNHNGGGQWQETILFNQPGSRPEDTVEIEAFTLANINGESHTYSWENGPPIKWAPKLEDRVFPEPAKANIQMANFRSRWKPYIIFEPGVKIEGFGIPPSRDYSKFPCWNHWPVAQLPNDGRKVIVSDRPSSFSLSSSRPVIHRDENGASVSFLYGMTDQPVTSLVPLSKSWNSAPVASIKCTGFDGGAYDKSQRAYVFTGKDPEAGALEFSLDASEDSPVFNPGIVVKSWGDREAVLEINGQTIKRGKDFRYGFRRTAQGTDLIVWIKQTSSIPEHVVIK